MSKVWARLVLVLAFVGVPRKISSYRHYLLQVKQWHRTSNTDRIIKLGTAHGSKTVQPSNTANPPQRHASIRLVHRQGLFSCFFTPQSARACFLVDLAKLFNHRKSLCPCISLSYAYLPMGSKTVRPSNTANPPRRHASIRLVYRARPFFLLFYLSPCKGMLFC